MERTNKKSWSFHIQTLGSGYATVQLYLKKHHVWGWMGPAEPFQECEVKLHCFSDTSLPSFLCLRNSVKIIIAKKINKPQHWKENKNFQQVGRWRGNEQSPFLYPFWAEMDRTVGGGQDKLQCSRPLLCRSLGVTGIIWIGYKASLFSSP